VLNFGASEKMNPATSIRIPNTRQAVAVRDPAAIRVTVVARHFIRLVSLFWWRP
jgi:hypothetical protein